MPVTTYRPNLPSVDDEEINELLEALCRYSGREWHVAKYPQVVRGWFGRTKDLPDYWELLLHIQGIEYQVFQCTTTRREVMAYLIGAVGAYERDGDGPDQSEFTLGELNGSAVIFRNGSIVSQQELYGLLCGLGKGMGL